MVSSAVGLYYAPDYHDNKEREKAQTGRGVYEEKREREPCVCMRWWVVNSAGGRTRQGVHLAHIILENN